MVFCMKFDNETEALAYNDLKNAVRFLILCYDNDKSKIWIEEMRKSMKVLT